MVDVFDTLNVDIQENRLYGGDENQVQTPFNPRRVLYHISFDHIPHGYNVYIIENKGIKTK